MKTTDIKIGHVYNNGRGRLREVVDIGPQYTAYDGQKCTENLRYRVVSDGTKNNRTAGTEGNMTVASFASWARWEDATHVS